MEPRISVVTLGVADLTRARAFYQAIGWSGARQPDDEVCFFPAGGMVLALWTAVGGHGAPGVELAHNVRAPEEVAAVLEDARQAGGSLVRPAARTDWGGTAGAFADPDGYVWEVAHNPDWTIADGRVDQHLSRRTRAEPPARSRSARPGPDGRGGLSYSPGPPW